MNRRTCGKASLSLSFLWEWSLQQVFRKSTCLPFPAIYIQNHKYAAELRVKKAGKNVPVSRASKASRVYFQYMRHSILLIKLGNKIEVTYVC